MSFIIIFRVVCVSVYPILVSVMTQEHIEHID